ncbi:MAG: PCRF domain-containing protein, partial [Dehalococcoidia bacterium]|nr:PCRF domain-containing protein [Dehalococcoidia bacterium]
MKNVALATIWCVFDIVSMETETAELEHVVASPDFWSDVTAAQIKVRRLAELKKVVSQWRAVERIAAEMEELILLDEEHPSSGMEAEITS